MSQRKRIIQGALTTLFAIIAVTQWVAFMNKIDKYSCDGAPVVMSAGTTLWQVTRDHCFGNLENALDDMVRVYGTDIPIGRQVFTPTNQDCELRLTDGGQVMEDC